MLAAKFDRRLGTDDGRRPRGGRRASFKPQLERSRCVPRWPRTRLSRPPVVVQTRGSAKRPKGLGPETSNSGGDDRPRQGRLIDPAIWSTRSARRTRALDRQENILTTGGLRGRGSGKGESRTDGGGGMPGGGHARHDVGTRLAGRNLVGVAASPEPWAPSGFRETSRAGGGVSPQHEDLVRTLGPAPAALATAFTAGPGPAPNPGKARGGVTGEGPAAERDASMRAAW